MSMLQKCYFQHRASGAVVVSRTLAKMSRRSVFMIPSIVESSLHPRFKQNSNGRRRAFLTKGNTGGSKIVSSAKEALHLAWESGKIPDPSSKNGIKVAIGGFGLCGIPETSTAALAEDDRYTNLTLCGVTTGIDNFAHGLLLEKPGNKVRRLLAAYVGENKHLAKRYLEGTLELELTPMGTVCQRLKAGGSGIGGFYTPTGVGTLYALGGMPIKYRENSGGAELDIVSEAKETRVMSDGREYVFEEALPTDLALVKAHKADSRGNLIFRGTAQNCNPDCAYSGRVVIAEAEEILEEGQYLDPNKVHLPGIFTTYVVPADCNEKRIERLRQLKRPTSSPDPIEERANEASKEDDAATLRRIRIMKRAGLEFRKGMYVNLGIGIPTLASNYVPDDVGVDSLTLHSENGLLGTGPYPYEGEADPDYVNAGKESVTALPGSSTFSISESFNIIRGGHLNLTMLGALQCSSQGDLASWIIPGKLVKGMGGAMDLVGAPGANVVVTMEHLSKKGEPKILDRCTLPLTGKGVVDRIITDMGVFDTPKRTSLKTLLVKEISPDITLDELRQNTACPLVIDDNLKCME